MKKKTKKILPGDRVVTAGNYDAFIYDSPLVDDPLPEIDRIFLRSGYRISIEGKPYFDYALVIASGIKAKAGRPHQGYAYWAYVMSSCGVVGYTLEGWIKKE